LSQHSANFSNFIDIFQESFVPTQSKDFYINF
jgi:hypothetical protein